MPRKPEGPRALAAAERQARRREHRAAEPLQLRALLDEALDVLEQLAVRTSSYVDERYVDVCSLCGCVDSHIDNCIIPRAKQILDD
jgi:hypothetical protein